VHAHHVHLVLHRAGHGGEHELEHPGGGDKHDDQHQGADREERG
jgi:hypothetical protein